MKSWRNQYICFYNTRCKIRYIFYNIYNTYNYYCISIIHEQEIFFLYMFMVNCIYAWNLYILIVYIIHDIKYNIYILYIDSSWTRDFFLIYLLYMLMVNFVYGWNLSILIVNFMCYCSCLMADLILNFSPLAFVAIQYKNGSQNSRDGS